MYMEFAFCARKKPPERLFSRQKGFSGIKKSSTELFGRGFIIFLANHRFSELRKRF